MTNDTSSSEFEMVKTCVEQAIEEFRNRDLQLYTTLMNVPQLTELRVIYKNIFPNGM